MVEMRFYEDEEGWLRAEVAAPYEVVGWLLRNDVQGNLRWTRELRALVADYAGGRRSEEWDGTGNAWTLILRPDGAFIELAVSDDFEPSGEVPLDVLDEALAGWERLLEELWDRWEAEGSCSARRGRGGSGAPDRARADESRAPSP